MVLSADGCYENMALAFIKEEDESAKEIVEDEDFVFLPPMLANEFKAQSTLMVRPWRRSENLVDQLNPNLTDIVGWQSGLFQMVTKVELQHIASIESRGSFKASLKTLTGQRLLDHFHQKPMVIQIGNVIQVQVDGTLQLLRVAKIEHLRDTGYLKKVLDIADDCNILTSTAEVTELTFNEHAGYLLHSAALHSVTVDDRSESADLLPKHAAGFAGLLKTVTPSYFSEALGAIKGRKGLVLLTGQAGSGKTSLLRHYADTTGHQFIQADCLCYFTLASLQTLFSEFAKRESPVVIELLNMHRFSLLLDQ